MTIRLLKHDDSSLKNDENDWFSKGKFTQTNWTGLVLNKTEDFSKSKKKILQWLFTGKWRFVDWAMMTFASWRSRGSRTVDEVTRNPLYQKSCVLLWNGWTLWSKMNFVVKNELFGKRCCVLGWKMMDFENNYGFRCRRSGRRTMKYVLKLKNHDYSIEDDDSSFENDDVCDRNDDVCDRSSSRRGHIRYSWRAVSFHVTNSRFCTRRWWLFFPWKMRILGDCLHLYVRLLTVFWFHSSSTRCSTFLLFYASFWLPALLYHLSWPTLH